MCATDGPVSLARVPARPDRVAGSSSLDSPPSGHPHTTVGHRAAADGTSVGTDETSVGTDGTAVRADWFLPAYLYTCSPGTDVITHHPPPSVQGDGSMNPADLQCRRSLADRAGRSHAAR